MRRARFTSSWGSRCPSRCRRRCGCAWALTSRVRGRCFRLGAHAFSVIDASGSVRLAGVVVVPPRPPTMITAGRVVRATFVDEVPEALAPQLETAGGTVAFTRVSARVWEAPRPAAGARDGDVAWSCDQSARGRFRNALTGVGREPAALVRPRVTQSSPVRALAWSRESSAPLPQACGELGTCFFFSESVRGDHAAPQELTHQPPRIARRRLRHDREIFERRRPHAQRIEHPQPARRSHPAIERRQLVVDLQPRRRDHRIIEAARPQPGSTRGSRQRAHRTATAPRARPHDR